MGRSVDRRGRAGRASLVRSRTRPRACARARASPRAWSRGRRLARDRSCPPLPRTPRARVAARRAFRSAPIRRNARACGRPRRPIGAPSSPGGVPAERARGRARAAPSARRGARREGSARARECASVGRAEDDASSPNRRGASPTRHRTHVNARVCSHQQIEGVRRVERVLTFRASSFSRPRAHDQARRVRAIALARARPSSRHHRARAFAPPRRRRAPRGHGERESSGAEEIRGGEVEPTVER